MQDGATRNNLLCSEEASPTRQLAPLLSTRRDFLDVLAPTRRQDGATRNKVTGAAAVEVHQAGRQLRGSGINLTEP